MEPTLTLLAIVLGALGGEPTQEPAPYPIDRAIWGDWGPVPEHAPPPPPDPIEVTQWLWLVGDVEAFAVFEEYVAEGRTPPREGAELEGPRWTNAAQPQGAVWAHASVEVAAAEVRMARLTGAEVLFVNGEGFWGDPRRYGFHGVPVALRAGRNELFVTGIDGTFELELWSPGTRCVIGTWDVAWPFTAGNDSGLFSADVGFPVFNASTTEVESLHVHYGHVAAEIGEPKPKVTDFNCGLSLAPLGMASAVTYFWGLSEYGFTGRAAVVPECVYAEGDVDADRKLLRGPFVDAPAEECANRRPERQASALWGSLLGRYGTETRWFVYGTAGTDAEDRRSLARARFDQQLVAYVSGRAPRLVSDRELLREEHREYHLEQDLVLYGNEDTNAAWKEIVPDDLGIRVRRGAVEIEDDDNVFPPDMGGWLDLGRVAVVFDSGPGGAALGYFGRWLATPVQPVDYAVYYGIVFPKAAGFVASEPNASGRFASRRRTR